MAIEPCQNEETRGQNGVSSFFLTAGCSVVTLPAVGRLPRTIDDGLVDHALNRGNNRSDVFGDDADRVAFLQALAKTKDRYPFRFLGYCLMTNHLHFCSAPRPGN
jgi:hypothetical protein